MIPKEACESQRELQLAYFYLPKIIEIIKIGNNLLGAHDIPIPMRPWSRNPDPELAKVRESHTNSFDLLNFKIELKPALFEPWKFYPNINCLIFSTKQLLRQLRIKCKNCIYYFRNCSVCSPLVAAAAEDDNKSYGGGSWATPILTNYLVSLLPRHPILQFPPFILVLLDDSYS